MPAKYARYAVFGGLTIIYILLRLQGLTSSCLWFDEIFSVHAAEHSWNSILSFVAQDLIHPPLFYLLLKVWVTAGGEGLFWLRSFPVFFSTLALIPFLLLCRELKFRFTAITLTFFIFAVNGSLIKYSQEVRMYAPLLCFSLFSIWLFVRFFGSRKGIAVLALVNLLLVYTHYFGWLVVLGETGAILWLKRDELKKIILMFGVVFAGFIPWIILIFNAAPASEKFSQNIGWMQRPGPITLFQFILNLLEPIYYKASSADNASNYPISLTLLIITIAAVVLYFRSSTREQPEEAKKLRILLVLFGVPLAIALVASWVLPYSVWGARHLVIVFVPSILLIAYAIDKTSKFKFFAAAIFAGLSIVAFGIQMSRGPATYIWCGWETLAQDVGASTETDKVYVFEDLVAYHFWFALRNSEGRFQVEKLEGLDKINEDKAYFLPRGFGGVKKKDIKDVTDDKCWIAFRAEKWDILRSPLYDLIARGYTLSEPRIFDAGIEKAYLVRVEK